MARTARKHSDTGVYHAILRGVNKQQVFEDEEVYERFLNVLRGQTLSDVDVQGQTVPPRYHVYTYCQMGNHVNLLLKEGIGPRTLSRLTDVPYSIVQRATSAENEKRLQSGMVCESTSEDEEWYSYCSPDEFEPYPEY